MKTIRSFYKRLITIIVVFAVSVMPALAQQVTEGGFWRDPLADPLLPFYVLVTFIFIVIILVVVVSVYMLKILNMIIRKTAEEKAAKLGVPYVPEPTWWQRIDRQLTDAVPVEKEETVMLDHNYDGIRELDNHLPPWWKWLFYATIAWSAVYLVVYHVTDSLPLMEEEYEQEVAKAVRSKPSGPVIDETTVELTTDAAVLQSGREIFLSNCASCHLTDGGGSIGPNLTDDYWLHGGSIGEVFAVIANGVPNTNMIPWKGALSPEKISDVSNYIMSLKGTTPANPKEPQGELYIEKKEAEAVPDSVISLR